MSGVLDDGDDVRSLLGHVHEVSARTMGELNRIHQTLLRGEGRGGKGRGGEGTRREAKKGKRGGVK